MHVDRLRRRLAYWLRFNTQEDDLREELELHRELLADDLQRQGLSPDAARITARRFAVRAVAFFGISRRLAFRALWHLAPSGTSRCLAPGAV